MSTQGAIDKILTFSKDSLHGELRKYTGQKMSYILPDFDKMPISNQNIGFETVTVMPNVNMVYGSQTTFKISRTEGFVSDFWLEVNLKNTATTNTFCPLPGFAMIDKIRISIGSEELLYYDGNALFQIVKDNNSDNSQLFGMFQTLSGGDTAAVIADGTKIYIPIYTPASTLDYSVPSLPLPLGYANGDLTIDIWTKAANLWQTVTTDSSPNEVKIYYKKTKGTLNDGVMPSFKSGKNSVMTFPSTYVKYDHQVQTLSTTAFVRLQSDAFIDSGDMEYLNVMAVTSANVGSRNYFLGASIPQLQLQLQNTNIYSHETANWGKIQYFNQMQGDNSQLIGANASITYVIPTTNKIVEDSSSLATQGINLSTQRPTVNIMGETAAAYDIYITAMYECVINFYEDGSVKLIKTPNDILGKIKTN